MNDIDIDVKPYRAYGVCIESVSRLAFRPVLRQEVRLVMHITARGDYAVQAMLVIAATSAEEELIQAAPLAGEQNIPLSFLQGILLDLVRAGLLHSIRGARGGYRLARGVLVTPRSR